MKRAIPAIVLLIVLAAAVWRFWPRGGPADSIRLTGNIEMTQVDIAFERPGRIAELKVREGDRVRRGDLIARLDRREILEQREQARAALEASRLRVEELKAQLEFQRRNVQREVEARRADLRQAQAFLSELQEGSRPQEVEEAQAAVRAAESRFEKAKSDLARAESLIEHEDISRQRYDQALTAFQTAQAALEQARERRDLVVEGPRRQDIEGARARVESARAAVELAASRRLEVRRTERAIETAQAEVQRARAALKEVEQRLEDSDAFAPVDGVVLVKSAEGGEVVAAGTPLVTLADTARPWLRAYIPAQYLGRVKIGAKAGVTTDSHPEKVYSGEVTFVASEAEFTPRQIQTPEQRAKLVYRIKISVENPDGELKLNMPCDAEVRLEARKSEQIGWAMDAMDPMNPMDPMDRKAGFLSMGSITRSRGRPHE